MYTDIMNIHILSGLSPNIFQAPVVQLNDAFILLNDSRETNPKW